MQFSAENEVYLKDAMLSDDKHAKIREISEKIKELEHKMSMGFNDSYLDVIKKCAVLERLHGDIKEMKNNSVELLASVEDVRLRQSSVTDEYDGVQLSIERVKEAQRGLMHVYEFLEQAMVLEKTKSVYQAVSSLKKMEAMKIFLKRYNFYKVLNACYRRLLDAFTNGLRERTVEWLEGIPLAGVGKAIDLGSKVEIFDVILYYRKQILPTDFLKVVYACKRLGLEKNMIELIDSKREEMLGAFSRELGARGRMSRDSNDAIYFSIAFILLTHYIAELLPGIRLFYNDIFKMIYDFDFSDVSVLIVLKKTLCALRLDSERLDEIIEKAAFKYFERKIQKENFVENIKLFIKSSVGFLDEISDFCNELDELLAKKVDDLLTEHLSAFDEEERDKYGRFAALQDEIQGIIALLVSRKPLLESFDFAVKDRIQRRNKAYIHEKYDDVRSRIKGAHDISTVVKTVISLKTFMNEECRRELLGMVCKNHKELLAGRSRDDVHLFADTIKRNYGTTIQ